MEITATFTKFIKRTILTLTIITIVSSISSASENSRFNTTFFDQSDPEAEKNAAASVDSTSESKSQSCNTFSKGCNNVPNVNKFRTIDGTCNNLKRKYCGAAGIPFVRYIPRSPSGSAFRCPLSSCERPRDISYALNNDCFSDHCDGVTVMVMQWGQFIDHDLVFTPGETVDDCCNDFGSGPYNKLTASNNNCVPIDVKGDPFYSSLDPPVTCLRFVRSKAARCTGSQDRENINDRTAYLDASMIYGSTQTIADSLRKFSGGKLEVHEDPSELSHETLTCPGSTPDICPRSFLPVRTNADGETEFFAGDSRVEEQPSLTSIHTLFLRLHNYIANGLKCSDNTDENIYQSTRKIVGAIVQAITYSEFLPLVLGQNIMNDIYYGPLSLDSFYSYNRSICASAPNVFAAAAFRFGHSLVPNEFHTSSGETIQLVESFNNHDVTLNPTSFPSHFLGGIIHQDAMPMDQMFVDTLRNKLFARGPPFHFGFDLYARNTQRGRDHGIPGYVEWYNACVDYNPSHTIKRFGDLYELMPDCVVEAFKNLYDSVHDIDLFPAGIAEYEVPGGLVGPTFACIIAEHFSNLKFGDRFWFQKSGVFTSSQVQSIRLIHLSTLICLFTNVDKIQPYVMLPRTGPSGSNPLTSCSVILKSFLNDANSKIWDSYC